MIIVRTPFRISFSGGGSDMRSFYSKHPGRVLSVSIDKHMYLAIHKYFDENVTIAKYSRTEMVTDVRNLEHPIIRQCLMDRGISGLDINSIADIPARTGLGSSSSFTVGLLHALYAYEGKYASRQTLAEEACRVEIEKLGEPIGKQDQYAAAYGGLNIFHFYEDESVHVEPVAASAAAIKKIESSLLLFFTGDVRDARSILSEQVANVTSDTQRFESLKKMTALVEPLMHSIYNADVEEFGRILHEGWIYKQELASAISNEKINHYYQLALDNGAIGGKLLGAGGGGFLMFVVHPEHQGRVREALTDLKEYSMGFGTTGSEVIHFQP